MERLGNLGLQAKGVIKGSRVNLAEMVCQDYVVSRVLLEQLVPQDLQGCLASLVMMANLV